MRSSRPLGWLTLAAAAWLLPPLPAVGAATAAAPELDPPVISLRDVPTLSDVLAQIDDRRVVFVGETHTRYDHHLVQLEVLKTLHRRHGDVAVGVEWFQYPFQQHLDDYLAGRITEAQMLERTGYFDRWRFDYRLYRPIVEYAKANAIPLVALNAPAELTKAIGKVGMAGLSEEQRRLLPSQYDRSDRVYEERLRGFFDSHPGGSRSFENFLNVMLTWDETMAERAADYLRTHPQRRMVIMAGSGHVAYGSGIPRRLERRIDISTAVLLVDWDRLDDPGAGDYVVMSDPRELPPAGLLGAFLKADDEGVRVAQLSGDSALREAGVGENDLLLSVDDQAVDSFAAVKLALLDRAPGETVTVRYRHRNWLGKDVERSAEVTLGGAVESSHP